METKSQALEDMSCGLMLEFDHDGQLQCEENEGCCHKVWVSDSKKYLAGKSEKDWVNKPDTVTPVTYQEEWPKLPSNHCNNLQEGNPECLTQVIK